MIAWLCQLVVALVRLLVSLLRVGALLLETVWIFACGASRIAWCRVEIFHLGSLAGFLEDLAAIVRFVNQIFNLKPRRRR
jgi:hypothetical protein